MIRLIFTALALIIFFILTLPLWIIVRIIRIWNPILAAKIGQPIVKWGFKFVLIPTGVKIEATGLENVPKEPVLFCANHRSFVDVPVFYTTVPNLTGIVSKKEIRKVPFLSWWMIVLNCIFLDRSDVKQALKTILKGVDNIKAGTSMCIMPEGTRVHDEEMLPFKEGSFKMAEKTGCPIVPVAMWKTDEVLELHMPWIRAHKVKIHYCEPIMVSELSRDEQKHVGAMARTAIENALKEMK